jgi:hypothetical protein
MANSSGGNSANRRPKGTGNRSASTSRRSGTSTTTPRAPVSPGATEELDGADAEPASRSADERARERLANRTAPRKPGASGAARRPQPGRGGAKGKNRAQAQSQGRAIALLSGGAVVLVAVVIILFSVLSGGGSSKVYAWHPAPASYIKAISGITQQQFNAAGDGSTLSGVGLAGALDRTPNQPPLTAKGPNGKTLPVLVYVGAEGCPFCAAARWALTIALYRFGSFSGLGIIKSDPLDSWGNTNTFSYSQAKYTSKYLIFEPLEKYSNVRCVSHCTATWDPMPYQGTALQNNLYNTYDSCKYYPPQQGSSGCGGIPFLDWAGKYVEAGGTPYPAYITGGDSSANWAPETWQEIINQLSLPNQGPGEAILASANVYSAMICQITNGQPGSVCNSAPVKAATTALLKYAKKVT